MTRRPYCWASARMLSYLVHASGCSCYPSSRFLDRVGLYSMFSPGKLLFDPAHAEVLSHLHGLVLLPAINFFLEKGVYAIGLYFGEGDGVRLSGDGISRTVGKGSQPRAFGEEGNQQDENAEPLESALARGSLLRIFRRGRKDGRNGQAADASRVGSSTALREPLARVPLELCMNEWAGEEEAAERCLPPFVGRLAIAC